MIDSNKLNNLKKLRESRGLKMSEVAKNLNIPYTTYVNYEKNKRKLPRDVMKAVAEYYGCSIEYVVGASEYTFNVKKLSKAIFAGADTISVADFDEAVKNLTDEDTAKDDKVLLGEDEQAFLQLFRIIPKEKRMDIIQQLVDLIPSDRLGEGASLVLSAIKTNKVV